MSKSVRFAAMSARCYAQARDELAIAEARGRRHDTHFRSTNYVMLLADETEDPDLNPPFDAAQNLHINFYEHDVANDEVVRMADRIAELLRRLRAIHEAH